MRGAGVFIYCFSKHTHTNTDQRFYTNPCSDDSYTDSVPCSSVAHFYCHCDQTTNRHSNRNTIYTNRHGNRNTIYTNRHGNRNTIYTNRYSNANSYFPAHFNTCNPNCYFKWREQRGYSSRKRK